MGRRLGQDDGDGGGPLRSGAGLVVAAVVAGGVVALRSGAARGALLGLLLLAVASVVLATAHRFAAPSGGAGDGTHRLSLGIMVTISLAIAGIGAVAGVTFMSAEDLLTLIVLLTFLGLLVLACGRVLARPLSRDLQDVRTSMEATGARPDQSESFQAATYSELDEVSRAGRAMLTRLASNEVERLATEHSRRDSLVAFSHDLRTPLTSLRLLTEAIQDELDPSVRLGYVRQLGRNVDALGTLVDDLFELARLESGDVRWSMHPVALDDIVEETVEAFLPAAQAKRVRLHTDIPPALPSVEAAPEKLQRVLFNLIHNALRHTPATGAVTVRVRPAADALEVEVADTGDGIAREERDRVFEAFYRASSSAGAGAGLGLAISRGIVLAHGGRIWVAEHAPGASVRFSLPCLAEPSRRAPA